VAGELERGDHQLEIVVPAEPTRLHMDPDRMVQMVIDR
jgi:hypothetical protein